MADLISVASSALPPGTRALAFRGTEAISMLYRFEIFLLVDDPAFDIDAALGASASLSIEREGTAPLVFHGVLATCESVDDLAGGTLYRAELAPRVFQLSLTQHSRVFVDETVPAILQMVLKEAGLGGDDVDFRLTGEYPRLPHVCQYRESNLAFLSRRMEREGIYFFFEQGQARERLVVTDDRAHHAAFSEEPVRYVRVGGAGALVAGGLKTFTSKRTSVPGSVRVRDYDYLRPTLDLSGQTSESGQGEDVHLYGENALTPEDSARLSRIRTEEHAAQRAVFRGAGGTMALRSGYTFTLEDHPRLDGSYLVTELTHLGKDVSGLPGLAALLGEEYEGDDGHGVEVVAIAASVQYRPPRRTPVPRIYGMEGAVVDGPADTDYAQLDEHGRYLVRMRFDESPAQDGKASARVRMMQPHGGNPESFHFPLRKGTDVLLAFEGGDPDRPVIAGVVPNLLNPSLVTSKNSTKNIIQTGGGNRLIIEDAEGKEYIHLATPHKRTFLHMGSTFNPQYNVIKNTDGTSLTYTTLLATSYTGDDTETIADRARVTVIGRSVMSTADFAGLEVKSWLGEPFVTSLADEIAPDDADANSTLLATAKSDQKNALAAAQTAAADWAALTIPAAPIPADWNQQALTDSGTDPLVTPVQSSVSAANTWATDTTTQKTIDAVAVAAKGASMITAITNLGKAITALQNATPPTAALLAAVVSAAQALVFAVDALSSVLKYDTANLPDSPNSNVTPKYINITRATPDTTHPSDVSALADTATAMDNAASPGTPSPRQSQSMLNPGSDLKVVGGDNVTVVKFDSRSHTMGTSYGLVLGGQASVVRNGQQSKVLSPAKSVAGASLDGPSTFTGLSFPLPALDATSNTAQRSEVYGDQFSWIDGSTNATITGSQTATVDGNRTTTIHGTVTTTVDGDQHSSVGGWLHPSLITSEYHGLQNTFMVGLRNTEVLGTDMSLVLGAKATILIGAGMSLRYGPQIDITSSSAFKVENLALHFHVLNSRESEIEISASWGGKVHTGSIVIGSPEMTILG